MDRSTFKVFLASASVFAALGLTACNDTGFSVSDLGQKELDKLNPKATPTPDPTNTSNPQPSPTPTTPAPSPTPTHPAPSPTPTVTANPSPTPTTPAPSPTPTVTATPTPPAPSPTPTVVPKAGADKFNVPALDTPKVDMLFCIDNSGSMDDKQQVLADSMSTFINQFVMGGVDYHIGIVTTDVDSTDAKYWSSRLPNYVTPNRGRLLSRYNEKFLTKNSSSVVDKMKANAKVGTSGSGNEQCFNSMLFALEDSMIASGGYNENFVRDDALLSMIIVSDEDEQISNGEGVAGRIDRMKKRISAIKGPNSRGFSFDFVINKTASKPAKVTYPLTASVNSYPNFYFAAADAFVSKTYDVLKNFGGDLAKIGSDIVVASTSQFKLSNKPNPASSIVVKLDGKVVAADPVNGYVYDASNNSITLKGDALQASPGGVLTIDYLY